MADLDEDPDRSADDLDPDTSLILDYLSNKLEAAEAQGVEERARRDKEFRFKLADMVLLKGLVTLALEKDPAPTAGACRRTRRLFLDYLRGRTSTSKTAALSRHLDECIECEMAFERLQSREAGRTERDGRGAFGRGAPAPRHLVMLGIAAIAIAAGAFGLVSLFSSAGASPARPSAAQGGGLVLRPAQVRGALADLLAADPTVDADGALSELVDAILDPAAMPFERGDAYQRMARAFGARAEPLLWVLAENEPVAPSRTAAYEALAAVGPTDARAMMAAGRREAQSRSEQTHLVVAMLVRQLDEDVREFLRGLLSGTPGEEDRWTIQNLRLVYGPMKGDRAVARCMQGCLLSGKDAVRAMAATIAADAGDPGAVDIATDLLGSADADARFHAVTVLKRHASKEQLLRALDRPAPPDTRNLILGVMESKGITVPHHQ